MNVVVTRNCAVRVSGVASAKSVPTFLWHNIRCCRDFYLSFKGRTVKRDNKGRRQSKRDVRKPRASPRGQQWPLYAYLSNSAVSPTATVTNDPIVDSIVYCFFIKGESICLIMRDRCRESRDLLSDFTARDWWFIVHITPTKCRWKLEIRQYFHFPYKNLCYIYARYSRIITYFYLNMIHFSITPISSKLSTWGFFRLLITNQQSEF